MEWIKAIATQLGATKIELFDDWKGKYNMKTIRSDSFTTLDSSDDEEAIAAQNDIVMQRANKHAFTSEQVDGIAGNLRTNGYYGMLNFEGQGSTKSVKTTDMEVIRGGVVDLSA